MCLSSRAPSILWPHSYLTLQFSLFHLESVFCKDHESENTLLYTTNNERVKFAKYSSDYFEGEMMRTRCSKERERMYERKTISNVHVEKSSQLVTVATTEQLEAEATAVSTVTLRLCKSWIFFSPLHPFSVCMMIMRMFFTARTKCLGFANKLRWRTHLVFFLKRGGKKCKWTHMHSMRRVKEISLTFSH